MLLSRRYFFFGSLALPVWGAKDPPARPHLLLILADGLPAWALGCYGNKEIRTPHLDRLAQMGTRFTHHLAAAPHAEVNLGTLLAGRTPMQLGDVFTLPSGETTLEKILTDQGYVCHTTGASGALAFLDAPPAGKPFFLRVNLNPLRPPYDNAPEKYRELYAQTRFDTLNPQGPEAVPILRKAAAGITALDGEIQTIFTRVMQRKLLDHCLVIFTSTCGDPLSHHGLWGPSGTSGTVHMYEESLATPMIWVWPGRVPAQATRPELISAYDLLPTLCETFSIDLPDRNLCGRSYTLLATGKPLPKKEPWRTTVFAHYRNTGMARIQRHKLIQHDGGKGPGELYALIADPAEKVNQYDNPQFVTVRNSLTAELSAWQRRYSS
jgi:arylsulfatase A-like enzyme